MQCKIAASGGQTGFYPAHRVGVIEVISNSREVDKMNSFVLSKLVYVRVSIDYSFNLANRFNDGKKPGQVQQVSVAVFQGMVEA